MEALKGKAVASLVLGIIACVFGWFSVTIFLGIIGLVCGIIGLVLAIGVRKQVQALGEQPTSMMTAGLVLSIIGTILSAILFVSCGLCIACSATAGGLGSLGSFRW